MSVHDPLAQISKSKTDRCMHRLTLMALSAILLTLNFLECPPFLQMASVRTPQRSEPGLLWCSIQLCTVLSNYGDLINVQPPIELWFKILNPAVVTSRLEYNAAKKLPATIQRERYTKARVSWLTRTQMVRCPFTTHL